MPCKVYLHQGQKGDNSITHFSQISKTYLRVLFKNNYRLKLLCLKRFTLFYLTSNKREIHISLLLEKLNVKNWCNFLNLLEHAKFVSILKFQIVFFVSLENFHFKLLNQLVRSVVIYALCMTTFSQPFAICSRIGNRAAKIQTTIRLICLLINFSLYSIFVPIWSFLGTYIHNNYTVSNDMYKICLRTAS